VVVAGFSRDGWKSAMSRFGSGTYKCSLISQVLSANTTSSSSQRNGHIDGLCVLRWFQKPSSKRSMIVASVPTNYLRAQVEQCNVPVRNAVAHRYINAAFATTNSTTSTSSVLQRKGNIDGLCVLRRFQNPTRKRT
jgi:hypothetical protein